MRKLEEETEDFHGTFAGGGGAGIKEEVGEIRKDGAKV